MTPNNQLSNSNQKSTNSNLNNTQFVTGLRKSNPLSNFSSYNYQLTLYMCTPECISRFIPMEAFASNEKENFIVAQSGGISKTDLRALTYDGRLTSDGKTGPGYDFYIDDLVFETTVTGGYKPTMETKFSFKITEPLGYTLLTKMSLAAKQINSLSDIISTSGAQPNLFQQNYVLGIRFYGYDENGNLMSASTGNSKVKEYAHFQKYYQLTISKCVFTLDGKAVVYNFEAYYTPTYIPIRVTDNTIKSGSTIKAGTIDEALTGTNGLVQILNNQQFDEKDTKRVKKVNTYKINFIDDEIKNSTLLDDNEYELSVTPMSTATITPEVNVKRSVTTTTYDNNKKQIAINPGTPAISIIDNIIAKSNYVAKGLTSVNNQAIETASKDKQNNTELTWYTIIPTAVPTGYDDINHTWVHEITYNIQKYKIPYIRTLYKNNTNKYYGSHKEYNYVFTGLNTEIISYQQEFNTLFYVIQTMSTTPDNANKKKIDSTVPIATQNGTNSSVDQSKLNRGSEIASNVKSNVNSIADLAIANITIMGDPDYMSQGISAPENFVSEFYKRLYGTDEYSINPYGGQIFIEIIFRMAEDYQDNGLLDVNNSISIYERNDKAREAGIKGIVYRLNKITSTFSKGRFTQLLNSTIVSENELGFNDEENQRAENQYPSETNRLFRLNREIDEENQRVENQSQAEANRLLQLNRKIQEATPIRNDISDIVNRQREPLANNTFVLTGGSSRIPFNR